MKRALSKKNLWEKTPAPVKAVLGSALSVVPLPFLLGADFRRWYRFACEADRWDAERIRAYQLERLRSIISLAFEKAPFYRDSFRSVGFEPGDLQSVEDMQDLPTIDKATVREHWQQMLTRPITDPKVDLVTTGGTSGEPLRFYMPASRHATEFAHLTACWKRVGYTPGDTMAVLRGRVITRPVDGLYHQFDPLLRHHYYSSFHMSGPDLAGYARHLARARPAFLHAYPSSLFAFAQHLLSEQVSMPSSVRAALVESEPVFSHQREIVQSKLGLRVFSAYGLSEKVILAAECESSHDYHVVPTYGFCEIVDRQGRAVPLAARGELVGTGFMGDVMPFIRYRTGDDATHLASRCQACGREHTLLQDINPRRSQEFLLCADGCSLISMTALNLHDDTLDGVVRFQFVQDQPGKAVLKLVLGNYGARHDLARIQAHFDKKLAGRIDLQISVVAEIPLTRVGKQPLILQRCPQVASLAGTMVGAPGAEVPAPASVAF